MVNFGWSPMTNWGALVRPRTASVASGQSSPSLSTGGGATAAVGVSAGCSGFWPAGGTTGDLTSGAAPGAAPDFSAAAFPALPPVVLAPAELLTTATMIATTMPIATTAMPN